MSTAQTRGSNDVKCLQRRDRSLQHAQHLLGRGGSTQRGTLHLGIVARDEIERRNCKQFDVFQLQALNTSDKRGQSAMNLRGVIPHDRPTLGETQKSPQPTTLRSGSGRQPPPAAAAAAKAPSVGKAMPHRCAAECNTSLQGLFGYMLKSRGAV